MKNLIFVFSCILFISANAQGDDQLIELANSKEFRKGSLGFYAYNINTKSEVSSFNSEKWMIPASILKLATTIVAIELLGEDHRFITKVGYSGKIEEGVLKGDLIIKGGGDPSLGFDITTGEYKFPDDFFSAVFSSLKAKGISEIDGGLIVDNSRFSRQAIPTNWVWGDIGNYYGAGSYALNFCGNRYSVFFKSGKLEGSLAQVGDVYPRIELDFDNHVKTANIYNDQAYIFSSPTSNEVYMEGEIPMGKTAFEVKGSIPDPALFFLQTLNKQLFSKKINVSGDLRVEYDQLKMDSELYVHSSPRLKELVVYTNKFSDNFFAEIIMKELGASRGKGSTSNGIRVLQNYLSEKGINAGNFNISDASGLSRTNLISAKGMVDLLLSNFQNGSTKFTELGLSISGKNGSLKRVGKGTCLEGKTVGKSGYMRNVRSYTGMHQNEKGENIAFCIMLNNFDCTAGKARELISEILSSSFCP